MVSSHGHNLSVGRFYAPTRETVSPARILRIYCAVTFVIGVALALAMVYLVRHQDIEANAAAILTLCWNVLFLMILPLILDSCERKYFNARFMQLEELAESNPELKAALEEQCRKLAIPGLRLATVDSRFSEPFSYGLWRQNPRLIVPDACLKSHDEAVKMIPSIEFELTRFARHDVTVIFLLFSAAQVLLEVVLLKVA
jgi:hypothetical protein